MYLTLRLVATLNHFFSAIYLTSDLMMKTTFSFTCLPSIILYLQDMNVTRDCCWGVYVLQNITLGLQKLATLSVIYSPGKRIYIQRLSVLITNFFIFFWAMSSIFIPVIWIGIIYLVSKYGNNSIVLYCSVKEYIIPHMPYHAPLPGNTGLYNLQ